MYSEAYQLYEYYILLDTEEENDIGTTQNY